MNWILALFAFAGIMAVMSTIASVVVEGIHKVFALRGGGLHEMLRALHDGVVMPLDPEYPDVTQGLAAGGTKRASQFAKQMTRSPAYRGKAHGFNLSSLPLLNVFNRRFENLSKLQFVEQLTQTDYGQRLSSMSRPQIKQSLNRLVYEFDRYGAGQSQFFQSRAKIFTMVVALFIVSIGNVNAMEIYFHLAQNKEISQQVLNSLDASGGVERVAGNLGAQAANLIESEDAIATRVSRVPADFSILSRSGFPVGRDFFPYCDNPKNYNCDISTRMKSVSLFGIYDSAAIPRMLTLEGVKWFLCMLVTAGLIGLGANFWFNLFKAMASLVMRNATAGTLSSTQAVNSVPVTAKGEVRRPVERRGSLASPGSEPDLDLLTDAFLTVAGKDVSDTPTGVFTGLNQDRFSGIDVGVDGVASSGGGVPKKPQTGVYVGEMPSRSGPPPRAHFNGSPSSSANSIRKYRG